MRYGYYANIFWFYSHLAKPTFVLYFFFIFLQAYVLGLWVSVKATVRAKVRVRFRVYLLRLVRFNQAYCTLVVRYCYATGGLLKSYPISRSTGVSVAIAF